MALAAAALRKEWLPDSQGRLNGNYPDGRDPAFDLEVNWLPLPFVQFVEGVADGFDLADYIAGDDVLDGTITLHPSDSLGSGVTLVGTVITYSGTGVSSGSVKWRWTLDADATVIRDSGVQQYAVEASTVEVDTTAPAIPIKLTAIETLVGGAPSVIFEVDPGSDPIVTGDPTAGLKELRILESGGLVKTQAVTLTLTPQLVGQDVGTTDSAGSTVQAGNSYTLTDNGGLGATPATEGYHAALINLTGDWIASVTIPAVASITGDAPTWAVGLMVLDSAVAGSRRSVALATSTAVRNRTVLTAGTSGSSAGTSYTRPTGAFPVRVQKVGDTLSWEFFADGSWQSLREQTFPVSQSHVLALFATSADTGVSVTAPFTNFQVQQGGRITTTLTPVTPGSKTYTARWTDNAGTPNVSADSVSAAVTVSTPDDATAPSVPGTPDVTATSDTTVSLTWAASTDAQSGVRGYEIHRSATLGGVYAQVGTEVATNSGGDSGLTASTEYFYEILAIDNAGNASALSAAGSATTQAAPEPGDITPPSKPTGPVAIGLSTTQIQFSWTASTDAESGVDGYRVWVGDTELDQPQELTSGITPGTSITESGLPALKDRWYRVRAYNGVGLASGSTAAVKGTTQAGTTPPSNVVYWYVRTGASPTPINTPIETALPTGTHILSGRPYPVLSSAVTYGGDQYSYLSHVVYDDAGGFDHERVETRVIPSESAGITSRNYPSEMWYGFRLYRQGPWPIDAVNWEILCQWHAGFDDYDTYPKNPTMSFDTRAGTDYLTINHAFSGNGSPTSSETRSSAAYSLTDADQRMVWKVNQWDTWAVHVKWHYENTGFLRIYRDGQLLINKTNIVTTFNNNLGPYFKWGIYKKPWYFPTKSFTTQGVQITERKAYHARIYALRKSDNPTLTDAQCLAAVNP